MDGRGFTHRPKFGRSYWSYLLVRKSLHRLLVLMGVMGPNFIVPRLPVRPRARASSGLVSRGRLLGQFTADIIVGVVRKSWSFSSPHEHAEPAREPALNRDSAVVSTWCRVGCMASHTVAFAPRAGELMARMQRTRRERRRALHQACSKEAATRRAASRVP